MYSWLLLDGLKFYINANLTSHTLGSTALDVLYHWHVKWSGALVIEDLFSFRNVVVVNHKLLQ